METAIAVLIGCFFAIGIYLILSQHVIRILLGIVVLGNGVNLTLFTAGRLTREVPPIIPNGQAIPFVEVANPLPQALVLTAIVISFSLFAFLLVLSFRAYETLKTDDTRDMRIAEPVDEPSPPIGY